MLRKIFYFLIVFLLGVMFTLAVRPSPNHTVTTTTYAAGGPSDESFVTKIIGTTNGDQPSPYDWIGESEISVGRDKVVISVKNAEWSRFTDTNSMDPVIDKGANAIQVRPQNEADIHVGDIISYESDYTDGIVIHRVIETGYDNKGWYAIAKGDNNSREDPGKIRFSQIKRIVIAIIY